MQIPRAGQAPPRGPKPVLSLDAVVVAIAVVDAQGLGAVAQLARTVNGLERRCSSGAGTQLSKLGQLTASMNIRRSSAVQAGE